MNGAESETRNRKPPQGGSGTAPPSAATQDAAAIPAQAPAQPRTCGEFYREALRRYSTFEYDGGGTHTDPRAYRAFAAGFVTGQAEKVYLGACVAAMFRPSEDRLSLMRELLDDITPRYGLTVVWMGWPRGGKRGYMGQVAVPEPSDPLHDGPRVEFEAEFEAWICRPASAPVVARMRLLTRNSPEWHTLRAMLCGVPVGEVDVRFHERVGAGERCD